MLEFSPLQLSDRESYLRCYQSENCRSSTYSFGTAYLWSLQCRRNVAVLGERIVVEYLCCSQNPFYGWPLGRGDVREVINALREHAEANERRFVLKAITAEEKTALEAAFPDCFDYSAEEDNFDYIYDAQALATLAGKKLHGKRNHCNRFAATYDWRCEKLTPALFEDCRSILNSWAESNDGGSEEEKLAIDCALANWEALGFCGAILYADGQPVAFTMGEFLGSDTVDVHFEKAVEGIQGAYPMICREFVRQLLEENPNLRYVNREEDMGIPGLRKAKEDWYPLYKLEKFTAVWKN
ncbi:MAG: DUF2156 domain-containing protein [Ruminococcaceae bacterium]|nr:DUF2156 domain-containing protein [Oscillospiraceae bacterium]